MTAPTQPLRVPVDNRVDIPVVDLARSATRYVLRHNASVAYLTSTSAPRSDTLLATAQRLEVTDNRVVTEVATVATRVDTVDDKVDRPATHAVALVTCLATAHKDRSATTVVKSVTCPVTAPRSPPMSAPATSASSQDTSRLPAQTKHFTPYHGWTTHFNDFRRGSGWSARMVVHKEKAENER